MHPSNFPSQLREKEREFKRTELMSKLPYIIVLLSEDKDRGDIYGYRVMQTTRKDFKTPTGPSDVYPMLQKLEEQGVLNSTDVIFNGRYRKIYRPVEPIASELLETYFRAKDAIDSEFDKLREKIERNNSGIQVMACVPDAIIRSNKWINRSHIRREGLA